jgi:hypothetical protein
MNRGLWKALLALNYVALAFFIAVTVYASLVVTLVGPLRVTALDRAGVFNEDKLKEFDSENGTDLASNLRYNVGRWIAGPGITTAVHCGYTAIAVAISNIILLHLATPRRKDVGPTPMRPTYDATHVAPPNV